MTTIRLARIEDSDSMYRLVQEATRHMDNQGIPQWDDIYPSKAILNADIENQQMYLIEVEGRVAGLIVINEVQSPEYASVVWKHSGRVLVVHRLTIHPDYQRRKLASYLMDFAEEKAVTENYDCIRLDAFTRNPAAFALYENRGYRRAGTVLFRKGEFFCYEKKISAKRAINNSNTLRRRIADKSGKRRTATFNMSTMNDNLVSLLDAWPCCTLATVRIPDLPERERSFFADFVPAARTAIALGHHVTTEEEWTWYATGAGGEHCAADDHARGLCEMIRAELIQSGHETEIVNYPGRSGLQFRYVAQAAGLGAIGMNAFLFHPTWGPWIHLRVVATAAKLDIHPKKSGDQLCNQCTLCVTECPAGAIWDGAFSGLQCRSYRKARGEYDPYGPRGELRYCKRCIWVCPRGQRPQERDREGETVEQSHAADALTRR